MKKCLFSLIFLTLLTGSLFSHPSTHLDKKGHFLLGSMWWRQSSFNFGAESVKLHFPVVPKISQNGLQLVVTAYDRAACYIFTGYYPAIRNIDAHTYFSEKLQEAAIPPFEIIFQNTYQNIAGDWCLEYFTEDHLRANRLYTFIIVTPFNSYTLQAVVPHIGIAHQYEFFRDSFFINQRGYNR